MKYGQIFDTPTTRTRTRYRSPFGMFSATRFERLKTIFNGCLTDRPGTIKSLTLGVVHLTERFSHVGYQMDTELYEKNRASLHVDFQHPIRGITMKKLR